MSFTKKLRMTWRTLGNIPQPGETDQTCSAEAILDILINSGMEPFLNWQIVYTRRATRSQSHISTVRGWVRLDDRPERLPEEAMR
jgi:hypothetical protein